MVDIDRKDWPEKYDIYKLISLEDDIQQLINGEKVTQRRNDRYADPGDEMVLNGHTFVIKDIYPQKLKELSEEDAKQEGYDSLDEYKETLTSIHESVVWDPEQVVWTHVFKKK